MYGNLPPTDLALTSDHVAESVVVGTVVASLIATDPDAASTFSFSLVDGIGSTDNSSFAISDNKLTITSTADFETKSSYSIRIQVTNQGGGTLEKQFTINVTDVNEAPAITPNQTFTIAENSVNSTPIGFVEASDFDLTAPNNTLTFVITGGNTGGAFAINSSSGQISVANSLALDFEGTSQYSLQIQVSDAGIGNLSATQSVSVSVTNVNEAPEFEGNLAFSLDDNSAANSSVGAVTVNEPDSGDTLAYTITSGNVAGAFAIDSTTGEITVANSVPLDFESNETFTLSVLVTDNQGLTDTANVTVTLIDITEVPQLTLGGSVARFLNKQLAIAVLPQITVGGTAHLNGGTLTLNVNAIGSAKKLLDQFHIPSFSGLGASSGPLFVNGHLNLQIQLGGNATNSSIQAFLRGITFATKGKGLKAQTRTLNVTLSAAGQSSAVVQTISVRRRS